MLARLYSSLEKVELKSAIKMGLAAMLSLYIGLHFTNLFDRPDPLANALWCVLAAVVVLQTNLGGTYQAVLNRLSGVLIGSILGAFFSGLFGTEDTSLGIAVASTIMVCSFFNLKESYRIASLSVAAVMIPWGLNPVVSPWMFAFFRFIDTVLGVVIAMVIAHVIWPAEATTKMRSNLARILSIIEQLYRYTLLMGYRLDEKDKAIQDLLTEINQLFVQTHMMLSEAKLEVFLRPSNISIWIEILGSLENLFSATHALQQVFNRTLETIFDENLKHQLDDLVLKIDLAFKELEPKFEKWLAVPAIPAVLESETELNSQLVRFRDTHTTRKFNFDDVEKYFVFFYNLKLIVNELNRLNHLLDLFYSEREE